MATMPYQYLTFSDLYEEKVRSSAPSLPATGVSSTLSPVFLLPTASASHDSSAYRHQYLQPSRSHSFPRRQDVHSHAMLKTLTQDSDLVAAPSSHASSSSSSSSFSSPLHVDFLRVFKRKTSLKSWSRKNSGHTSDSSAFSTPTSSRRSSFASQGFSSLHNPASTASSANTSPAISRQVTKTPISDYEAMIHNTERQEQVDEANRQKELQAYFNQAAETGLGLRRF